MKIGVVRAFVAAALLVTAWRGGASAGCDGFVQRNHHVCRGRSSVLSPMLSSGHHSRGTTLTILPRPNTSGHPSGRRLSPYVGALRRHGDDRQPHVQDESGERELQSSRSSTTTSTPTTSIFHSYNNLEVDGFPVDYISWQLDDPTHDGVDEHRPAVHAAESLATGAVRRLRHLGSRFHPTGRTLHYTIRGTIEEVQLGIGLYVPPGCIPDLRDLRDLRDLKDRWGPKDRRARRVRWDLPAPRDRRVRRASPARWARSVRRVPWDLREKA